METKKLILRNIFCLLGKAELSKRQKEKRSEDEIMNSDNKGSEIILWGKKESAKIWGLIVENVKIIF